MENEQSEFHTALLKGLGILPTHYVLRWSPTLKPFQFLKFDLLAVQRCQTDGSLVALNASQAVLRHHAGHHLKDPVTFGLKEWLLVQLRIIR